MHQRVPGSQKALPSSLYPWPENPAPWFLALDLSPASSPCTKVKTQHKKKDATSSPRGNALQQPPKPFSRDVLFWSRTELSTRPAIRVFLLSFLL